MQAVREELRRFVTGNFLFGDGDKLPSDDESFLEKGIIDSTGVLELVAFVEEKYSVKIHDDELVPENLDSINSLTKFLERKLSAAS